MAPKGVYSSMCLPYDVHFGFCIRSLSPSGQNLEIHHLPQPTF